MSKENTEEIISILHEHGFRATPLRVLILKIIYTSPTPLTVEEIIKKTKRLKADDASIYRAISSFYEIELIEQHNLHNNKFSYSKKEDKHTHHIICNKCKKIETIDFCIKDLNKRVSAKSKMFKQILSHNLSFVGTCRKCVRSVR